MSTDFSEKERAFVAGLAADTGRDLAAWLSAIGASGLTHRNDIIDWLRQQGFPFSKASWIERIHHNGGRLIYGDASAKPAAVSGPRKPRPAAVPQTQSQTAHKLASDGELEILMASAKAYRPLAQVLLRDCLAAVPAADVSVQSGVIVLSHARPFAAIQPSARDVRLLLGGGKRNMPGSWQKAKPPPGLDTIAHLTHMTVLTDARQLTAELRELVASCAHDPAM
jgi:hypothetical protein